MEGAAAMIVIYTTFPSESGAREMGAKLVEEKLAACVNIVPGMISLYRWEGAIETGDETIMLVKTRKSMQKQILDFLSAGHPYSVPVLLVFEPQAVAAPYLEWLYNQTAVQG